MFVRHSTQSFPIFPTRIPHRWCGTLQVILHLSCISIISLILDSSNLQCPHACSVYSNIDNFSVNSAEGNRGLMPSDENQRHKRVHSKMHHFWHVKANHLTNLTPSLEMIFLTSSIGMRSPTSVDLVNSCAVLQRVSRPTHSWSLDKFSILKTAATINRLQSTYNTTLCPVDLMPWGTTKGFTNSIGSQSQLPVVSSTKIFSQTHPWGASLRNLDTKKTKQWSFFMKSLELIISI